MVKKGVMSTVKELLQSDPCLQDALVRGYANLSAVARSLEPSVRARLGKGVKLQSIITSVKRLRSHYSPPKARVMEVIGGSTVSVRTDVAKLSLARSRRGIEVVARLLAERWDDFLQVSESRSAITLIFDEKLLKVVKKALRGEEVLEEAKGLAAVVIHSPPSIIYTPGCASAFYAELSRKLINIEDTVSCHTDTIVVVKMKDATKAFACLTELIAAARKGGAHST